MSAFWRTSRKCWVFEFQKKKKTYYGSGFPTKRQAAHAEEELRETLRRGKPSLNSPTFRELSLDYLKKLNTYHTQLWANSARWKINRYFKPLFDTEADAIGSKDIQDILWELKGKLKPRSINELRTIAHAIFSLGMKSDPPLVSNNPAKNVPRFPIDDTPKYIPPEKHLLKVLKVATPRQKAHLLFIKNTMCRLSASRNVTRSDVNLRENWVVLKTRKKGVGEKGGGRFL